MPDVVSFRPTRDEVEAIERVRRAHGFRTRAEAVRYLVREGARQAVRWKDDPLFCFRIKGLARPGEDIDAADIDLALYGGE